MARSTLGRDYDIDAQLTKLRRDVDELRRRLLLTQGRVDAAGMWQAFTPAWANVTVGTGGTSAGRFSQVGQTVTVQLQLVLGTGGNVTGGLTLDLPRTPNVSLILNANSMLMVGVAGARDASAGTLEKGIAQLMNTGIVRFSPSDVPGGQWGTTLPFDWTVSDQLGATFTYETTDPVP